MSSLVLPPPAPAALLEGFPLIPEVDSTLEVRKMLDLAVATRAGVAVIAPKGTGKTAVLARVTAGWIAEQTQRSEAAGTAVQRLAEIGSLSAGTERECLCNVYVRLHSAPPKLKVRGGRKTDEQLLREIVTTALSQNVVAVLVEEAEFTSAAGMQVLRDLITMAAALDERGANVHVGGAARGIGVLAVGAPSFRATVERNPERGHRWTYVHELEPVPAAMVPTVYRRWFPAWEPHIAALPSAGWERYIEGTITRGQPVPIGLLIRHAQRYLEAARGVGAPIPRDLVPFHAGMFESLWFTQSEWRAA